jgi:hypothetical protein
LRSLKFSDFRCDCLKHTSEIRRDVGVPKPQHRDTALIEPAITPLVLRFIGGIRVLTTVQLDGKAQGRTVEVENK